MIGVKHKDIRRFFTKIKEVGSCWEWTSSIRKDGYGQFSFNGKPVLTHRFSFELFKGYIPINLDLDHLCRNRKCVNPDHLEAVTRSENLIRGNAVLKRGVEQSQKTHCPQGHQYLDDNLYVWKNEKNNTERHCRKCHNIQQQKYMKKKGVRK